MLVLINLIVVIIPQCIHISHCVLIITHGISQLHLNQFSSVHFSHSAVSDSLRLHESQHARPPCPSPTPGVHPNSCPSSQWCHPAISSCHHLLLLPPIPLSIRVFSNESNLCIRWPKCWRFSFNISPSNEYSGWFPLGWTGWIPLQSKGLSGVFSNITVWKHQFFSSQPSLWSNSHIQLWLDGPFLAKWCLCFLIHYVFIVFLPRSRHLLIMV